MQFAITIEGGDFLALPGLAREAERAGWDAFFIPDTLAIGTRGFDPWVMLAAIAIRTESIRLGTLITPVSRRRPWKLAREATTLDHISNGRLILGVGLGAADYDGGFGKVGEATDLRTRAKLLDEGLEILEGLWRGKPFSFSGVHYQIDKMTQLPVPIQSPRIPVWVVGVWPKERSLRRALRWDGIIPQKYKATASDMWMSAEDIRALKTIVDRERPHKKPFDIIVGPPPGTDRKKAAQIARELAAAGGTWWVDAIISSNHDKMLKAIKQGPPRF